MRDIRELLCGSLHIERIVFACDTIHVTHQPVFREEKRTHYYIGVCSTDRFLLIEISSPETANQPIDLVKFTAPAAVARSSDTDFYYNGPLITPRPRSATDPNLERAFRARLYPLWNCLQLGIMAAKPGSFRWENDHFAAEFTDEMKNRKETAFSVRFGEPGESVPESVKEKFLERLENPPEHQTAQRRLVKKVQQIIGLDGKMKWSNDGNTEPHPVIAPAPGSVEARILAHYATKHRERMAKGVTGQLLRDEQGNVFEIRVDDLAQRIELNYAPSTDLPLPWPHRIRRFAGSPKSEPEVPTHLMTIYFARTSDRPLDDAAFDLLHYLKEGTYVRGKAMPNGRFTLADPKDHKLFRGLLDIQASHR